MTKSEKIQGKAAFLPEWNTFDLNDVQRRAVERPSSHTPTPGSSCDLGSLRAGWDHQSRGHNQHHFQKHPEEDQTKVKMNLLQKHVLNEVLYIIQKGL